MIVLGAIFATVEIYSVRNDSWSKGPKVPIPIQSPALTPGDGKTTAAYLVGGQHYEPSIYSRTIYGLSIDLAAWRPLKQTLNVGRKHHMAFYVNNSAIAC